MIREIVLASRNPHKIDELRNLLQPLGIELKSALDFPHLEEVDEDRDTLEGNALKKSQYVFEQTGIPALSDDTGLEVDALNGAPGVYSARYAGEDASYADNVKKLLRELDGSDKRTGRFRTAMAFVTEEGDRIFEGTVEGQILRKGRGDKGFGYDPVFQPEGYDRSFAEMSQQEKAGISHRGRAVQAFLAYIRKQQEA